MFNKTNKQNVAGLQSNLAGDNESTKWQTKREFSLIYIISPFKPNQS